MTQRSLRFAPRAADDLSRMCLFLAERDLQGAEKALLAIRRALTMAAMMPFSCRKAARHPYVRECLISFGSAGYVALFEIGDDHILVTAIRHQREDDYH